MFRYGEAQQERCQFKHALVRDAAYNSLLRERRAEMHRRVATSLREFSPENVQPELLAHHYGEAGLFIDAASYWLVAGKHAVARSANPEAVAHLKRGISATTKADTSGKASSLEVDMQICLGTANTARGGYASTETENAYLRARELLGGSRDDPRAFSVLHGLTMSYMNQARFGDFSQAEEMLLHAQNMGQPLPMLVAHRILAVAKNGQGHFVDARAHAERAADLSNEHDLSELSGQYGHDLGVGVYWHLAIPLLFMGRFDSAEAAGERAKELAANSRHENTAQYSSLWIGHNCLVRREWREAIEVGQRMLEEAKTQSMAMWQVFGRYILGCGLAATGHGKVTLDELSRAREEAERVNILWFRPTALRFAAQAYADASQLERSIECLREAEELLDSTNERWWAPEVHRFKAEIYARCERESGEIDQALGQALGIAREQESKLFELRASMDLAQLWNQQGRSDEARALLQPILDYFTEGVGTPELTAGRAFLAELSLS